MDQVLAMMLLLSCPDSMQGCREMPELAQSYATIAECEADYPRVMGLASRESPLVIAKCLDIDTSQKGTPKLAWSIDKDNQLNASIIYTEFLAEPKPLELTMNDVEISKTGRLR